MTTSSATMTWDGADGGEQDDPSAAELTVRVGQLDGRQRTIVTLERASGHLAVGGSAAAGLVVYAELDGRFHQARSPDPGSSRPVTVVTGGQPGEHEPRLVVTLAAALTVATEFLVTGSLSTQVEWETT